MALLLRFRAVSRVSSLLLLGLSDCRSFGIRDSLTVILSEAPTVVPLTGWRGGEVLAVETGSFDLAWLLCLVGDFSRGGASLGFVSGTSSVSW